MTVLPLTDDQDRQLQAWRAIALEEMPYFADILFSARPLNAPGLGTWAVDAQWRLYIDFEACMRDRSFLWNVESVLHEASHLYADHSTSAEDLGITKSTQKVWNAGADLSINDDLDAIGCKTFRQDKMLPEFIGEEDGQTPHHYYAVLQRKMSVKADANVKPSMSLRPGSIAEGKAAGTKVTAQIRPAFLDPDDFTFDISALDDTPVNIRGITARGSSALTFEIFDELAVGDYIATLVSGGRTVEATLHIEAPSIAMNPDHVASDWTAPLPLTVFGRHTEFNAGVTVVVTSPDDQQVAVTAVTCVSSTHVTFKVAQQVPDGIYLVQVTDRGVPLRTCLPIGQPRLDISPAHLPVGYDAPHLLGAMVTDMPLDDTSTFEVHVPGLGALPGALSNVTVKTSAYAEMDLASLPEGRYAVVVTTGDISASASLIVSDEVSDDGDSSEGEGGGGEGEGDGTGEFKGCGSGSGGEAWAGELAPDDDLNGAAPAIEAIEKESVRLNTAAAIKDYVAKGRGTVPAGLIAIADKILEASTTPWEQVLASAFRQSVNSKRGHSLVDHRRVSRRRSNQTIMTPHGTQRLFVPGKYTPKPTVELIRDTSGSMGAIDLAIVTREAERIAKKIGIRGDDFMVTDVDAAVQGTKKFRGRASIKEIKGRGGTSMTVGIEASWARKKNRPSTIVVATDGGTDWPTTPGPIPVIAALIPPHGLSSPEYVEHIAAMVPDWIKVVICEPGKVAA